MKTNTATNFAPMQIIMDIAGMQEHDHVNMDAANNAPDVVTFREYAPDLDDKQVLDYILTLSASRDRNTLGATLLDHFGSLKNVLEARPEQLLAINGVGEKTAKLISSFIPVMNAWKRRVNDLPKKISNRTEAQNYCQSLVSGLRYEQFWVVCLNTKCEVVGKRKIADGSLCEVAAYPRMVVETALNYNAHSIILTHNHPGGTQTPSPEDISSTVQLQKVLNGIGITVLDHIIVAGDVTYSMIQHGDIKFR